MRETVRRGDAVVSGANQAGRAGATGRFRPYPAYKDSGVEWLGEIPAHWEVKPIRALARPGYKTFTDGDWIESPFIRDEGIRLIQTGNVGVGGYREQGFRYIDEETFRAFRCSEVLPGDVLICRLADPVGRACLAPDLACRMITSVDVCILKPASDDHAAFVVHALTGSEYLAWLAGICRGGTRDRVSRSMLGAIRVQRPPLAEQSSIAAYLDRETARIDALVAKKERLIELLQAKRTALITRAVTKGLDPNVPMKDSGVEWLGEIPAHWEVKRLRHISPSLGVGVVVNPSNYVADEGLPFLYGSDIGEGQIHAAEARRISRQDSRRLPKSELRPGDLVMVRVGAPGVTAVVPPDLDGANCASLLVIRRSHGLASSWLCYALNSRYVRSQIEVVQYGAAQEQFNVSHARNFVIALPPLREQDSIADYLDRETARIDALVSKVRDAIARLKELRTALISAAVTGKIDVRQEVA